MTVPMTKLQENLNRIGIYVEPVLNSHEMSTSETGYDWVKDEYHRTESNIIPVEASAIELGYEIDRLKKDAAFHKQTLINYQNETQAQLKDYQNLHVDYMNSQYQVKLLQAQVDKIPTLKRTIRYMMAEHLDIELGDK